MAHNMRLFGRMTDCYGADGHIRVLIGDCTASSPSGLTCRSATFLCTVRICILLLTKLASPIERNMMVSVEVLEFDITAC